VGRQPWAAFLSVNPCPLGRKFNLKITDQNLILSLISEKAYQFSFNRSNLWQNGWSEDDMTKASTFSDCSFISFACPKALLLPNIEKPISPLR
jgi:hypothetical protein